jgi:hypothetical protein
LSCQEAARNALVRDAVEQDSGALQPISNSLPKSVSGVVEIVLQENNVLFNHHLVEAI